MDLLYQISDEPIFKKDEDPDESNTDNSNSETPNSENPYVVTSSADDPYDLINTNKPNTDKLNIEETNTAHPAFAVKNPKARNLSPKLS
ncbi:MAG: hypothetical protein LIO74_08410 [Ruminococcus sp.]|nr:hypothetical protein [Ruminococcus sp.]